MRDSGGRSRAGPEDFVREYGALFGMTDAAAQLRVSNVKADALGWTHTTFQQVHKGIPVFSGVLKVHQDGGGNVVVGNGDVYRIPPAITVEPGITEDDAVARAMAAVMAPRASPTGGPKPRPDQVEVESRELTIVDPGWYGDRPIGPRLAYYLVLADLPVGFREAFFVDAQFGEILDRWSLVCPLRDRWVYDAFGTSDFPGTLVRGEGGAPTGVYDVDATYDYLGDTYGYLFRAFERDGIDDMGMSMVATVRTRVIPCPNAAWTGEQAQFCPDVVSDDIIAHEMMHGVTESTAGLIYQNQPGQLNESYSDVVGELVDLFNGNAAFPGPPGGDPWPIHPTGPGTDTPNQHRTDSCDDLGRWLVAEDAGAFGAPIRDMWNPPCRGHPDRANSPLQTCDSRDAGGVHSGSGIPNHAFAMLTDGKTFNGQTVEPIGPIKAAAIWYRALTAYLTPASDFQDAYYALVQSASDLVGTTPNDPRTGLPSASSITVADVAELNKALTATEMNTMGNCGGGSPVLDATPAFRCPLRTTIFRDDFESGAAGWTVSNSGPPTPYDWMLTTSALPLARSGVAWFCQDRDIGNCEEDDESGVHTLRSPPVQLPLDATDAVVSFDHFMRVQGNWDGGNVKIRVNGGPWELIPRDAFEHNPYNGRLYTATLLGNTNPLAGQPAWTGFGGEWGTSVASLGRFAGGGDVIEFLFEFGKDGCVGFTGWFIDNFEIYVCPDCNGNGIADDEEYRFHYVSEVIVGLGGEWTRQLRVPTPRRRAET